jgi:hypothetical protein
MGGSEAGEDIQQADRIGATRDGHADPVARVQHDITRDGSGDFFDQNGVRDLIVSPTENQCPLT